MVYQPHPIITSEIRLSKEILNLLELLAKNNHENWAAQRLSEGWKYGPRRSDIKKEHPGLIPYEELSESEKEYDRITVTESLKAILALGYQIEKKK
jgi:hypothetical protein